MLRVGLTGGIACGKSHVLRRLAAHGFATLDLDQVSRDVVAPGEPALAAIAEAFGRRVLGPDGVLDRAALGAIVFADAAARARLNAIVHPRVRAAEAAWAGARAAAGAEVAVTDAALIVETGAHLRFDRIVVVHCDAAEQLARLRARDGLDETAARARVAAQMPVGEKRVFGHFEVDTSGAETDTEVRADALAQALREAARRPAAPAVPLARLEAVVAAGSAAGPRGLSPLALLRTAARAGGLEMEALAARLSPPAQGSWLEAPRGAPPGAPAAVLAPAVVAWALARPGSADPEFVASAAGSVARLTHEDAGERAAACLCALVIQEALVAGAPLDDVAGAAARLEPRAARWGGGPPSPWLADLWARVHRGSSGADDREPLAAALAAASGRSSAAGEDPSVAATLGRIAAATR
jgi:dephospho-CoA kinase